MLAAGRAAAVSWRWREQVGNRHDSAAADSPGAASTATLIEPWRLLRRDGWQYVLESPRPLFYKMLNVN